MKVGGCAAWGLAEVDKHFSRMRLPSDSIFANSSVLDEKVHCRQCENLSVHCLEKSAHVFTSDVESATSDAGDDVIVFAFLIM